MVQSSSQLTATDWTHIGAFALLVFGLALINTKLAEVVGVGAIVLIALKGWSLS